MNIQLQINALSIVSKLFLIGLICDLLAWLWATQAVINGPVKPDVVASRTILFINHGNPVYITPNQSFILDHGVLLAFILFVGWRGLHWLQKRLSK